MGCWTECFDISAFPYGSYSFKIPRNREEKGETLDLLKTSLMKSQERTSNCKGTIQPILKNTKLCFSVCGDVGTTKSPSMSSFNIFTLFSML